VLPLEWLIKGDDRVGITVGDTSDSSDLSVGSNIVCGRNDDVLSDLPIVLNSLDVFESDGCGPGLSSLL
jgi:hypothetical protein